MCSQAKFSPFFFSLRTFHLFLPLFWLLLEFWGLGFIEHPFYLVLNSFLSGISQHSSFQVLALAIFPSLLSQESCLLCFPPQLNSSTACFCSPFLQNLQVQWFRYYFRVGIRNIIGLNPFLCSAAQLRWLSPALLVLLPLWQED